MDVSQCAEYLKRWCLEIYGVRRHVRGRWRIYTASLSEGQDEPTKMFEFERGAKENMKLA